MIRGFFGEIHRRDAVLSTAGWLNAALLAALIAVAAFDDRTILGLNRWVKPMKFAASIAIYVWTVAWLLGHVRDQRRLTLAISRGIAFVMVLEIACIVVQAARGTTSHYNIATAFDARVFNLMGLGIVVNTLLATWLFALYLRRLPLPAAYLWGIRLGLFVFVAGSLEGAVMISRAAHTVGLPDGGPGLPFVNWSTLGGDLRAAHALGLHALQVLPFFGYVISRRLATRPASAQLSALAGFSALYFSAALYLFWLALNGRPVLAIRTTVSKIPRYTVPR